MAKKVSTNKITNLSQDWGLDTSNGLPYSGQSVQDFIKEGLATANTAYSERWGAVYFDSATYTLLGFKNEDDKETYLAGGDSSLVIGRETFNFSGTINQIKIINRMSSNTVYFTNTSETANLTVGFISQQKGITDQDWTEILEDFYVTISVDKGSTGEFVNIETNKLVLNGFDYTFDVKKYVAFGGNRVRVTATGVTTNTTTNFIFNVHLTSMYLSPSNFAWNKPFVEGEAYNLGGMNIGGNINKLLKVKVTNDKLGYSRVFEENLKTATYITNSYFYKGLVFPETGTGVYHVEIWLDADGLESDHLHYNIMCIANADKATASLININEVFEADNGTDADLFKYSIYNAGMASGNPYFKISKDGETAREETLEGVPTASIQTYSAALEFESEEAMFDILVDASIGDYHQQAAVTIDNTTSFPAVADATFYMNAATRSNNQTNRDKFINEISGEEISTTFSNIAWVDGTDGWTVDKSGRKCLLLPARSKMTVNTQPLALIGQGKTIEVAFKVGNAADYDEPIFTIGDAMITPDPIDYNIELKNGFFDPTYNVVSSSSTYKYSSPILLQEGDEVVFKVSGYGYTALRECYADGVHKAVLIKYKDSASQPVEGTEVRYKAKCEMWVQICTRTAMFDQYPPYIIKPRDPYYNPNFRGICVRPKNILIHSRDLHTNDLAQSYNLKDDELVHLIITIVKNYKTNYGNLAQIYVNGVKTTSFAFTNTDDFTSKASLVLGSNTADLYIYKMRVYENGFGWQDSIQNYINCLPGVVEKVAAWDKISSVIDDSYNLDYDAVFGKYNTMVIEMLDGKPLPDKLNPSGDNPPLCNLEINIVDPIEGELDEDFAQFFNGTPILNQTIEGQGTTAMTYYRWNFRWKMDKTYNKRRITAKKNVASSMHSHKMGATRLYNDLHNAVVGFNDANARVAVFQYPVYGFLKTLVEGTTDQYVYTGIGLYTIGPDKGDKVTFGYDQSEFKNSVMHLEGTDHTPMSVGFDYPWAETQYLGSKEAMGAITKDGSIAAAWEVGAAGDYDPEDNPTEVKAMLDVEFKPAYEVVYNNSTCILGVTETLEEINTNPVAWRKKVAENGKSYSELEFWTDDVYDLYYYNVQQETFKSNGINLLTQLNIDASELTGLDIDAKNELFKARRRENFIANWENYWDKDDALFHDVILEIIAASDNFKKNNYPYKFKPLAEGGRWCRRQDDLDSIFDVNNQGFAAKLYSVLMGDKTATGSGSVFRGENSIFHTLVHECFKEEKKQMAHRIFDAMAELSPYGSSQIDRLVGYIQNLFWDKAQDYFTKSAYNIDAEWTYEEAWPLRTQGIYVNDVDPLQQSLGSHIEAERNWVELRMVFMASYYNWGPFATDNGDDASTGQVSFRAAGGKTYTITPALDLNPTILIGQSDLATYGDRVLAGTPIEVTVPDMGNNDTHVYIQGTDYVADLGDLSDLQVSADNPVLTVASKRLRKLKTGDETAENVTSNVADMGIGYCPSLEEIDSRNLASLTGTVDLTQCSRLRKALFEGTNVANLQISAGSKIEELSLPDTVTTLSLIRLPNLTEDNLKYNSLNALSYLRLENNDNINNFEMLKNAYTNSTALKNIRVVGFEYNADANDIAMIARFATDKDENGNPVYQGIGDNGDPTLGLPVLDGTFILEGYLYESDYNTVKANYPKLNIEAAGFYIDFEDPAMLQFLLNNLSIDDGVGLTIEQVESLTSIPRPVTNTSITSFDEFERFINVASLPNSNNSWNNGFFRGCTGLRSIKLPPKITTLLHSTFGGCTSLQSYGDLSNIVSIGGRCFQNCPLTGVEVNLPALESINHGAYLNTGIVKIESLGKLTTISDGTYVNGISMGVFRECTSLIEANLPDTLVKIGSYAFYGDTALATINYDWSKLVTLGESAFYGCTSLVFDELRTPNLESLGENAFYGVTIKKWLDMGKITSLTVGGADKTVLEELVVPETVTTLSNSALNGYTALNTLTIDWSKITKVGSYVLTGVPALTNVELVIPNLATIESYAFNGSLVKSIDLTGSTITSVGRMFEQSPNLEKVVLPETVTSIGAYMLKQSPNVKDLIVRTVAPPSLNGDAFGQAPNTFLIYVPAASLTSYREATNWINYASRIFPIEDYMDGGIFTFADPAVEAICVANWDTNNSTYMSKGEVERVTSIGTVFSGNTEITNFNELEQFTGITSIIGNGSSTAGAFKNSSIESLRLPNTVTSIQPYAFFGCTELASLGKLPSSITSIGQSAFQGCSVLSDIELSHALTSFGVAAFYKASALAIDIDEPNLTYIGNYAFAQSGITSITNLGKITTLPDGASPGDRPGVFTNCESLESVVLPSTLTTIGAFAFYGGTALTTIDCDWSKITKINKYAFSGCTALEFDELNLENLTSLGEGMFNGVKIKRLVLGKITSLPQHAYDSGPTTYGDRTYLEELVLPNTLTSIGQRGLMKYSALKYLDIPASVTSIGTNAFHSCSGLQYVIVRNPVVPTLSTGVFTSTNDCPIYVPDESVEAYKTATNWSAYASRIYPMSAYEEFIAGDIIEFADPAVEAICVANWDTNGSGYMSKNECAKVTSLQNIFTSNTEITSFEELVNFTGLTTIYGSGYGGSAFDGCTNLGKVVLPSTITKIGYTAFRNTSNLDMALPSSITSIENSAFENSGISGDLYLPNLEGTLLETTFIGTQIQRISSLGKITRIAGSTNWSSGAFRGCTQLMFAELPDTLLTIEAAFTDCSSLATVIVNAVTPPTLDSYAFTNCSALTSIYVPDEAVDTYKSATNWSTYASKIKPLSEYTE